MANSTDTLQKIPVNVLKEILDACSATFQQELGTENQFQGGNTTWAIPEIGLTSETKESEIRLRKFVSGLSGTDNMRQTWAIINTEWEAKVKGYETTMAGAPTSGVESNTLTPEQLKQFAKENEVRTDIEKKIRIDSDKTVRDALEKQKELYAQEIAKAKALEVKLETQQKVYVKLTKPQIQPDAQVAILIEQAKSNPKQFVIDTKEQFVKNPILQNYSPEEADLVAGQASLTVFNTVNGNSPLAQTAKINAYINSSFAPPEIKDIANDLINTQHLAQYKLALQFFNSTKFDGIIKSEDYIVEISDKPQAGFEEFDPRGNILNPHIDSLIGQNMLLDEVRGLSVNEIKPRLLLYAGKVLDSQIAKLPAQSFLARLYEGRVVQSTISYFGLVEAVPFTAAPGSFIGSVFEITGNAQLVGLIQGATGLNLGMTQVVATTVATTGTEAATTAIGGAVGATATTVAVAAGGEAMGAQIGAAVGSLIPGLGTILGAIGGAVAGWLSTKIPWKKIKKYFPRALAIGTFFGLAGVFGPVVGLAGGLGVLAISSGVGLGGIATGFWGFFSLFYIGNTFRFLKLLLGVFLSIAGAYALVLFIINSGAYMVPPTTPESPFQGGGGCSTDKGPVGIPGGQSSSPIANRAWEITADLYQGFWCFWNRSPKAPAPYFPDDVLLYPPGYPGLFDYSLFLSNPNPAPSSGPNLFWCTWLVVKAYQEKGVGIGTLIYTPNMFNDFNNRNKIIRAEDATPANLREGSVIFFHVTTGANRLNHVGIVYSVDDGGIEIVESNAPLKHEWFGFNRSGRGIQNHGVMEVRFFGLP